jgi:hypothetical protein
MEVQPMTIRLPGIKNLSLLEKRHKKALGKCSFRPHFPRG